MIDPDSFDEDAVMSEANYALECFVRRPALGVHHVQVAGPLVLLPTVGDVMQEVELIEVRRPVSLGWSLNVVTPDFVEVVAMGDIVTQVVSQTISIAERRREAKARVTA